MAEFDVVNLRSISFSDEAAPPPPPPPSGFTPADLLPDAWFDPSDLSTCWQDSAATIPANLGDPVARIDDKSGNGRHAVAPSDVSRPILRDGYLEFDGANDDLAFESPCQGTVAHTVWGAVKNNGADSSGVWLELGENAGTGGSMRRFTNECAIRVSGGNQFYDDSVGPGLAVTIGHIAPDSPSTTDDRCWLNGVELGVTGTSARAMNSGPNSHICAAPDQSIWSQMDAYGLVVLTRAIDDTERQNLDNWLSSKLPSF